MIHEIAIWKLVLAGIVLACFSFLVGFFLAAIFNEMARREEAEITRRILWGNPKVKEALGILDGDDLIEK